MNDETKNYIDSKFEELQKTLHSFAVAVGKGFKVNGVNDQIMKQDLKHIGDLLYAMRYDQKVERLRTDRLEDAIF